MNTYEIDEKNVDKLVKAMVNLCIVSFLVGCGIGVILTKVFL